MIPRDFSSRRHFPGTVTSPFDWTIRFADAVESLPAPVFALVLIAFALMPARADFAQATVLWLFFLGDWALIAALPRAGRSFGPAKPPTLLLAVLRGLPALFPFPWNLIAESVGTALVIYGFWIEPHQIQVTFQRLHSSKFKTIKPLRVLHLGDLHVERITVRERQLLELIRVLKPDLILFSGDFLSLSNVHDPVAREHAREILREWRAPLGVFAVTGSPPVDEPEVVAKLLDRLPVRWLTNEKVTLAFEGQPFDVVGITCSHKPFEDRAALDSVLQSKPDRLTILLYHSPDLAPEAAMREIDLQLSGHTHGGQVRVPFFGALYTASLYGKRLEVGRHQIGGMTLYVTRGIGMEGKGAPRARFLCPPEIVVWEIGA